MEAEGVIERVRGTGMRVRAAAAKGSLAERRRELRPLIRQLVVRARQLQLTDEQILVEVKSVLQSDKRNERPIQT
jgi:DNA-binding transcriptional regulator YhcF (GntR family)